VSSRKLLAKLTLQIVLQGRSTALSEAMVTKTGADFCVTGAGKNGQIPDYLG